MRNYGFHVLTCLARLAAGISSSAFRLSIVLGFLGMLPSARADFLYAPITSEPILSASLTANVGGLYGNRFLFGVEMNSAFQTAAPSCFPCLSSSMETPSGPHFRKEPR